MTVKFRVSTHLTRGVGIVEVWVDGQMLGTIYPSERSVRLMSKYIADVTEVPPTGDVRAVEVSFVRRTSAE